MKNSEKCMILRQLTSTASVSEYYKALEKLGDMKSNYGDYLITEPINVDEELRRVFDADFDLCRALLTMLFRENYFDNGSFEHRVERGDVKLLVERMRDLLREELQ